MTHTPTGKSAFDNKFHFPQNKQGKRLKGFSATYKRMEWDKPAPTITMRNDAISSQSNVHPGRERRDGTYSDARVLTLRELFILSSINPDIDLPTDVSEIQIRQIIGESVPPLMIKKICEGIKIK
jgi:DNA (cytosine-5)-methyltransferase 1